MAAVVKFRGHGKGGKVGWKSRRYCADGTIVETRHDGTLWRVDAKGRARPLEARGPRKKVAVHTSFQPFTTWQVTKSAAERCGAHREGHKTHFTTEKQLRTYLANEKAEGRHVYWKQHDQTSDLTPT